MAKEETSRLVGQMSHHLLCKACFTRATNIIAARVDGGSTFMEWHSRNSADTVSNNMMETTFAGSVSREMKWPC